MKELTLIGRAEKADLPELNLKRVPVKVDTGADASSIWAQAVVDDNDRLNVTFFGPDSPFYTGQVYVFPKSAYSITRVASSFGHKEIRYKLKLKIKVKGRVIKGSFTLADRSNKLYPILIGRSLLKNKFLVDVSKGKPLIAEEKARSQKLQEELNSLNER